MNNNINEYKSIVLIRSLSQKGAASLLRSISQIIISLDIEKKESISELGFYNQTNATLDLNGLRIGVHNHAPSETELEVALNDLIQKECKIIFVTAPDKEAVLDTIKEFSEKHVFEVLNLVAKWSEKLDVDYLSQDQIDQVMSEVKKALLLPA